MFCTAEHGGTYIDAPNHFYQNGNPVDLISVDRMISAGVVIDITERGLKTPDYQVQVEDYLAWETMHGSRLDSVIVLLRTGFGKY